MEILKYKYLKIVLEWSIWVLSCLSPACCEFYATIYIVPYYFVGFAITPWNVSALSSLQSRFSWVSLIQTSDKILIAAEWIYKATALLKPQRKVNSKAKHEKIARWNNVCIKNALPFLECLDIRHENNKTPHSTVESTSVTIHVEITIRGAIHTTFG